MRLHHILFERISDIVYHATKLSSAVEIINGNKFKLSSSIENPDEQSFEKRGLKWYLSVTRNKTSSYHSQWLSGVIFVLDGKKLSQRYTGSPVDFFSKDIGPENKRSEHEDRIFSKTNTIAFSPYIKSILIFNQSRNGGNKVLVKQVAEAAIKQNIPYKIYLTRKDWLLQTKNYIDLDAYLQQAGELTEPQTNNNSKLGESVLDTLIDLLKAEKESSLTGDMSFMIDDFREGFYNEILQSIEAGRKPGSSEYDKVVFIVNFMRKHRLNKIADLVQFVISKFDGK